MALAANKHPEIKTDEILSVKVADNVHIYRGAMVCIDPATGYANPAADAAGYTFAGIALEEVDNTLTGHAAGGKSVRLQRKGSFAATIVGAAQTDMDAPVFVSDDETVATAGIINNVAVGRISEYISATSVRVAFNLP